MLVNLGLNDVKVLSSLLFKPKYGLEIIEDTKEESDTAISLGSLYNTLHRLEKNAYVKSKWGEQTAERGGNRRRYYELTGLGEKALRDVQTSLQALWLEPA